MRSFFEEQLLKAYPPVSPEMMDKLFTMYSMLVEHNDEMDLSRIKNGKDLVIKHFVDSLIILRYVKLPASLVDIGTGAGFPGLPLAICCPGTHFILAEPKGQRVDFMHMVQQATGITNIEIYPHKVTEKTNFSVQGLITRAFETVDTTMSRARFLPPRGQLIFLKGPGADEDIAGIGDENQKAFTLKNDIHYSLPGTTHERRLLVFEKASSSQSRSFLLSENPYMTAGVNVRSSENKNFKLLKKAVAPGGLKKTSMTMVCGKKQICDVHHGDPSRARFLVLCEEYVENDASMLSIIDEIDKGGKLLLLQKSLYRELDTLETGLPLYFCALPEISDIGALGRETKAPVLLIPFQDPQNLGSVIRSAAAFGVHDIIIVDTTVNPYHPRAIRASSGAVFQCRFYRAASVENAVSFLDAGGYSIAALDRSGQAIDTITPTLPLCLVTGIEGAGLSDDLKTRSWSIPISAEVESLNAAVSASIALYEITKKLRIADHV